MDILDLLLEADPTKLKEKAKKDYEIKRLSRLLGEKFIVTCYPLTHEQVTHIGEISKNNTDAKLNAILEACRLSGHKLGDQQLMEKYKAATPKELVVNLFLPGEVYSLYETVNQLSGYGRDAVAEIKNS